MTNEPETPTEKTLSELAEMSDEDIDFSDIPELGDEFWSRAISSDELSYQVTFGGN